MATSARQRRVLLVDGYIRQHEKILNLSTMVPISINSIIFDFQLLVAKWSKTWSNPKVNISDDESIVEIKNTRKEQKAWYSEYVTMYGENVVKYGDNFVWYLEIIKGEKCQPLIGIIPNKQNLLKKHQDNYAWHYDGGYIWAVSSGFFGYDGKANQYSYNIHIMINNQH